MIENLPTKAEINVYDMWGQVVKNLSIEPEQSINLSELEKGNYLIEILLPGNNKRLKLIQF